MQVASPNNIKIYNLSAGKSLPEWLSDRKRRALLKKNVDIRRRIELIQDFDMPGVSSSIKVSKDGHYVIATGIYKPRVKCFDVNNLSLKFERCFDSEVVNFEIISEDYSKMIFLQCDRHIEFHAAHGKYHRLRIPRFGRDLQYHYPSCDLFVVGVSNEIYRINLERGQFLKPYQSEATAINKCSINPVHNLLAVGTQEGRVEAYDPRIRDRVGILDVGFDCTQFIQSQSTKMETVPSITALKFQGGLTMAVGTVTGQILLYDIRSNKPFLIKDQKNSLPIRNIEFHEQMDLVYSMDSSVVKIWEKQTGNLYTSIAATADLNDLCIIQGTGMLFLANEEQKMQTYYIPSLGPAPSWSSFLDNLTEELEELNTQTIYDDYKFVTEKELEELGLDNLKGTNLLRAYMHGYFMDVRLWKKTMNIMKPFAFEEYKKKKIREKLDEGLVSRVNIEKLPQVNKELAFKIKENEAENDANKKKKKKNITGVSLLKDDRFKALFTNPDYQVDKNAEEYHLLNPVISQLDKNKFKKFRAQEETELKEKILTAFDDVEEHNEGDSDEELLRDDSSDDEKTWSKDVKRNYRQLSRARREEEKEKRREEEKKNAEAEGTKDGVIKKEPRFFEVKEGMEFRHGKTYMRKRNNASLGNRLQSEEANPIRVTGSRGNREMTFITGKRKFSGAPRDGVKHRRTDLKGRLRPAGNIGKRKY